MHRRAERPSDPGAAVSSTWFLMVCVGMFFAGIPVAAKPQDDGPLLDVTVIVPPGAPTQVLRDRQDPVDTLVIRVERSAEGLVTIRLYNVDERDTRFKIEPDVENHHGCGLRFDVLYPDPERRVRFRWGIGARYPDPPVYNGEETFPPAAHEVIGVGRCFPESYEVSNLPFYSAGAVPDGDRVSGAPLQIEKDGSGGLVLKWDPSCQASDADYEVYEGALGDFGSHAPILCSTHGNTTTTVTSGSGSRYYLVVPRNGRREGSYGTRSDGTEIQPAASPCLVQKTEPCRPN